MNEPTASHRSKAPVGVSDRLRLARAARTATLAVPGIIGTDTGPMGTYVTVAGGERLEGIICAAANDGGHDVSVRLIAALVPLPQLSVQVTAAIEHAATRIRVPCSGVAVHFADVVQSGVW
jgi:hypothetical protein